MANNTFGDSGGESILPDSENTVTSDQARAAAPTLPTTIVIRRVSGTPPKNPVKLEALSKKPLKEENTAKSTISFRRIMPKVLVTTDTQQVKVTAGSPMLPAPTPAIAPAITPAPLNSNAAFNYICLDSDEEETVTHTPPPARPSFTLPQATTITSIATPITSIPPVPTYTQIKQNQVATTPVPVSLTMANAPRVTLPLLQNMASVVAPMPQQTTLQIRQVAPGLHSNFVLVTSDQLAITKSNTPQLLSTVVQPSVHPQSPSQTPPQPPPPKPELKSQPVSLLLPPKNTKTQAKAKLPATSKKGDIKRITRSSKIAIVQKPDSGVTALASMKSIDLTDKPNVPSTSKASTSKTSTVTINLTGDITETPKKQEQKKAASKPASQTTETSKSNCNDSLSLFKDVIQIQAANYSESPTPQQKKKTSVVCTEKINDTKIFVEHISINNKRQTTLKLADGKKLTPVPHNKVPKQIDAAVKINIEGLNKTRALEAKEQDKIVRKALPSMDKSATGKKLEKKGSSSNAKASTSASSCTVDLT